MSVMKNTLGKRKRRARQDSESVIIAHCVYMLELQKLFFFKLTELVIGEINRHLTCLTEPQPKLFGLGAYFSRKCVWGGKTLHENSRRN